MHCFVDESEIHILLCVLKKVPNNPHKMLSYYHLEEIPTLVRETVVIGVCTIEIIELL